MKPAALAILAALTGGQERPEWDQKKALAKVQTTLDIEKTGEKPWDKIAWVTDPKEAARRAQEERKPILVYIFKKIKQEWDEPEKWGRC